MAENGWRVDMKREGDAYLKRRLSFNLSLRMVGPPPPTSATVVPCHHASQMISTRSKMTEDFKGIHLNTEYHGLVVWCAEDVSPKPIGIRLPSYRESLVLLIRARGRSSIIRTVLLHSSPSSSQPFSFGFP